MQRVITAHQDQGQRAVKQVNQGLDLAVGSRLVLGGEIVDGAYAGGREGFGRGKHHSPFGRIIYGGQPGRRLLDVRGVIAVRAVDDEIFAGWGRADELDGVRAAHRAVGGLRLPGRDAEALERAGVGVTVGAEGHVELLPA